MAVNQADNHDRCPWRLPTEFDRPILALDTTDEVTVAVVDRTGVLATGSNNEPRRHVESLIPMIRAALDQAGVAVADLAGIAAGTGPAPYTGLRIGLVTALSLGRAADKPVWGVSGLDAIAGACAGDLGGPAAASAAVSASAPGRTVVAVADAKRHEVFWAQYRFDPTTSAADWARPVAGPGVCAPAELPGQIELLPETHLAGPATDLCQELAGMVDLCAPAPVSASALAVLAAGRHLAGCEQEARPIYLRHPDVQVPGGRKRATT